MSSLPILLIPGWNGSPPGHWQYWLAQRHPEWRMLVQDNWAEPNLSEWLVSLESAIAACPKPPLLVAHSVGSLLVAHGCLQHQFQVEALILVAPADSEQEDFPQSIRGFAPVPQVALGMPGIVIGSGNDPYMDSQRCRSLADAWDLVYVHQGDAGHINVDSGYGPWPAMEERLLGWRGAAGLNK